MKLTNKPPAGAAVVATKVTVETFPGPLESVEGAAVTVTVGTADVTTTDAELGVPML